MRPPLLSQSLKRDFLVKTCVRYICALLESALDKDMGAETAVMLIYIFHFSAQESLPDRVICGKSSTMSNLPRNTKCQAYYRFIITAQR
jgi:hypothetical protein